MVYLCPTSGGDCTGNTTSGTYVLYNLQPCIFKTQHMLSSSSGYTAPVLQAVTKESSKGLIGCCVIREKTSVTL